MSSRKIDVHPEAVAEARAAAEWYRERSDSAANAFLAEIDHAIERISRGPEVWPLYVQGTRRFLLHRFPFSVVYREVLGNIQIVAVAHAKRRPGYWKRRIA
ncbi:MAG: type II toxin-antitoxin system RelE/ParE family toxin [Pseudomonadota bacterium]